MVARWSEISLCACVAGAHFSLSYFFIIIVTDAKFQTQKWLVSQPVAGDKYEISVGCLFHILDCDFPELDKLKKVNEFDWVSEVENHH